MADSQMLNKFRKLVNKNQNPENSLGNLEVSGNQDYSIQSKILQSPERLQNKNDKIIDEIPKGRPSVFNLLQKFDKKAAEDSIKEKHNNNIRIENSPIKNESKERGSVLINKERNSALHNFKIANINQNEIDNPISTKEEVRIQPNTVNPEILTGNNHFKASLLRIDQSLKETTQINKEADDRIENKENILTIEINKPVEDSNKELKIIEEIPSVNKDEIIKETDSLLIDNLEIPNNQNKNINIYQNIKRIDLPKKDSITNILQKIRKHKNKSIEENNTIGNSDVNNNEKSSPKRENLYSLEIQMDLTDDDCDLDKDNEENEEKTNEKEENFKNGIPTEQPLPNYESPEFAQKQRLSVVDLIKFHEKRVKESLLRKRFTSPNNKFINEDDQKINEKNEINLIPVNQNDKKEEGPEETVNYRHTAAENFSDNIKEIKNFLKILKEGKQNTEDNVNELVKHNSDVYTSSGLMNKIDEEDLLNVQDLISFYEDKLESVKKSRLFENRLKHRNTVTVLRSNKKKNIKVSIIKEEDEEVSKQHSSKNLIKLVLDLKEKNEEIEVNNKSNTSYSV